MSRAAEEEAGVAYAFRLDARIPARFFGDKVQLSGWLVHRAGEPIHGIRAVVKRRFSRERIYKARRKRSRLDAAAAFPDLPGAKSSGFFLEVLLSLGVNRLRLQVLDTSRVWRTFHVAKVTALPLKSLERGGFPRVREILLSSLTRSYSDKTILEEQPVAATSPPRSSVIRRVELFATSKSNLFIREIGELIAGGFNELGCAAELHLDQPPSESPPNDTLQIVVTPHEFFNLYLTEQVSREEARRLARQTILLCTEQPETRWFQSNLQWAPYARGLADIHPLGVLAYRARDARCHHLPIGYHPMLRSSSVKTQEKRETEITFLGSLTPRREKFFGEHADFFSERRAHLRFVPLDFAKTDATRSYLSANRRNDLLADTKILLNVHYSEQRYCEWHRMLVGLANGCCIITDTCEGYGPLIPGEHFVMVEPEQLVAACEFYLQQPNECTRIARQGFEFVGKNLRQAQLCEGFLRGFESVGGNVAMDAPPIPLPRELRRNFSQLKRQAFRRAAAADLRDFLHKSTATETPAPAPNEEALAAQRASAIEKRTAYRSRLDEQERRRAAGENAWTLHDNSAYRQQAEPIISVVITLYNYAGFISDCVASIEHSATHFGEPIEIVIVDDASTDESLAEALLCQTRSGVPIRVVAKQFNTGLADARNVGTQLARAPLVFMMDADNLVFRPALRELFDAISIDNRAAAYSILARFRERPSVRFGLLSPYDWDPQILVQQPYVDAMALFRRDILLELGGYDNQLSQVGWFGWEDYDMWLRFAVRDLAVGFVPNTLCLYRQHDISMLSITNLFELELVSHFHDRFGTFCERFETQATLFGVDRRKINRGKTSFFIASGCPIATTTLYRCLHLREQLQKLGHEAKVAEWFSEAAIELDEALTYDVIVLYRLPMSDTLSRLIEQAHKLGKRIVFDTDDLVFEPDLIEWHRGAALLSLDDQQLYRQGVERYLATLVASDFVLTTTAVLAELAKARGKPAYVHRNALGKEMLKLASELYERRKELSAGEEAIVIGYGSGTPTHDLDFEEAAAALANILASYSKVELWIAGPLTLPAGLASYGERVRRFPLTDWRGWFALMSRMDIALAPLEQGNVFCRAKSAIKFLEAGALGIPIVASRIDSFVEAITDGQDGFLAGNVKEWEAALRLLVEGPSLRRAAGEAARRKVTHNDTSESRAAALAAILRETGCAKKISATGTLRLRLNWLIPEPSPGAGGDVGIFRIIRYLTESGHDCQVYVVSYNFMNDFSDEEVRAYIREHFGFSPAYYQRWNGAVRDADATFATFWPTAEILLALPNGGARYYLVQDFEPSFYPDDPAHYNRAEKTYSAGLRCLTLGPWLATLLRKRYGAKADHFDFAVDTHTYWPRPDLRSTRPRVCFYARPATPRRAYELGLEAFARVHEKLPDTEIAFFGADDLSPTPTFPFTNRGKLKQEDLATLFSSCDLGVVFSLSNPSFVPLEMMACGCPVLEIASERWDGVLTHGKTAWLVEPTAVAVANGIIKLLQNEALRRELVDAGIELTKGMSWRNSARQIEAALLKEVGV